MSRVPCNTKNTRVSWLPGLSWRPSWRRFCNGAGSSREQKMAPASDDDLSGRAKQAPGQLPSLQTQPEEPQLTVPEVQRSSISRSGGLRRLHPKKLIKTVCQVSVIRTLYLSSRFRGRIIVMRRARIRLARGAKISVAPGSRLALWAQDEPRHGIAVFAASPLQCSADRPRQCRDI